MRDTDNIFKRKEKIQYTTGIGFLITGIILCYISFFLNEYDIDNGSLWYLGQSVAFCAAIFSVNLMVKNEVRKYIDNEMNTNEEGNE